MATYNLTSSIPDGSDLKAGDILNCPYSGTYKTITLPEGKYKLECWGAQGGYRSSTSYGGKGGYSVGTLNLSDDTNLYLYAGGSGNTGGANGGFNGGGIRTSYNGGGGGSDIRIGSTSLYARVIVAGGGGSDGNSSKGGGAGGGTSGQATIASSFGSNDGPGTQTYSGSSSSTTASIQNSSSRCGGFGFGGSGIYSSSGYGGAGGGGWYGGSGTTPDSSGDDDRGGSGGSGYVYTSSTATNYPSGCLLNSSYYLTEASTVIGTSSFKDPDTGSSTTGRSGNGYIRITVIEVETGINITTTELTDDLITNGTILNCPYTGQYKTITLPKGKYKLECWGAQGGDANATYIGGKGGYSAGILDISSSRTLYLYVGGKGSTCTGSAVAGGFNGGGSGYGHSSYPAGSGGGGTDIRTSTTVGSRIIAAGGGGGAQSYSNAKNGCDGGGEFGGQHYVNSSYYAYGGTQSAAGTGYAAGTTGVGSTSTATYVAGGGGGYYPGGQGLRTAGGGGSGYVSTSIGHSILYPEMKSGVRTGNGRIKITVIERNTYTSKYNITSEINGKILKKGDIVTLLGQSVTKSITLPKGKYKLECWGARGGYSSTATLDFYDGGRGGYSKGILNLTQETILFLNTGTTGSTGTGSVVRGGYNGGGSGYGHSSYPAGSGGGGTDIRIGSNSLYARVIVAGGGGGANYYNYNTSGGKGGDGGGTSGTRGYYSSSYYGNGGTQTAAGTSNYATGAFGCANIASYTSYVAGGGGGWYPGGQGQQCPGGGGSGYVYTSSTATNYPSGCLLNSSYYLTETEMVSGANTGYNAGRIYITVLDIEENNDTIYDTGASARYFDINKLSINDIIECNYTNSKKSITLPKGRYKLECWGAQGGDANIPSNYNLGGNGGYSTGIINLTEDITTLYLYAGGRGSTARGSSTAGGFNGGGKGYGYTTYYAGSGGGGTDIRIGTDSLYSRVIVAGGGGGANTQYNTTSYPAGKGGGTSGTNCYYSSSYYGNGGTQTAAGTGNVATGTFGTGSTTNSTSYGAGGGGGWYPGGNSSYCSAGGGSGYVYTKANSVNYPEGCLLNESYYLEEASTTSLTSNAPANGKIRITVLDIIHNNTGYDITTDEINTNELSPSDIINCPYTDEVKSITLPPGEYKLECWGSEGNIGKGGYTSGIIHINNKNNTLNLYTGTNGDHTDIRINTNNLSDIVMKAGGNGDSGYTYNINSITPIDVDLEDSTLTVASLVENTIIINDKQAFIDPETNISTTGKSGNGYIRITVLDIIPNTEGEIFNVYELSDLNNVELNNNDIINCSYTGEAKTITLPKGRYKLECWGAQGGDASGISSGVNNYIEAKGGRGGYSTADIVLADETLLYLYSGGSGISSSSNNSSIGGFNGGAPSTANTSYITGSGGGGTDIRIGTDSLYARVIVAGGGGGACTYYNPNDYPAGTGGGISGGSCIYSDSYYANGASQISGGTGTDSTGTFGTAQKSSTTTIGGAGGGGWYGGGTSRYCSGAGGSGYVYNEDTYYYYPEGCLLKASDYLLDAVTENDVRTGNGKIRITVKDLGFELNRYNLANYESENTKLKNTDVLLCTYTNENRTVTLPKGRYKLECWGAQGGDANENFLGGEGGYSTGIINLSEPTTLYLYTGGKGLTAGVASTKGGFNGGGYAYSYSTSVIAGSGGGGTDIRIGSTSLYARVIVAGGGGGAHTYNSTQAGAGGGATGESVNYSSSYYSNGGTQTAAGAGSYATGTFGTGSTSTTTYVAGGGGGWYPGGQVRYAAAGGGSGYVYTKANSVNYPEGCLLNESYYLEEASTTTGGRTGHGKIAITCLDIDTDYNMYDLTKETPNPEDLLDNDILNCSYTGEAKTVTLPKGRYKLECWGARGGSADTSTVENKGGRGGYATGKLVLKDTTTLYLYAGGRGLTTEGGTVVDGGFNGGGSAKGYTSYPAGSGGGGTDIRIGEDSLYSRVIVAGGGGGANSMYNTVSYPAGTGGGELGTQGFYSTSYYGYGGTQTAAGAGTCSTGTFGIGSTTTTDYSAGGGGGWYPGGNSTRSSAGGGSGYTYSEDSQNDYPEGCTLISDDYLLDASMENDIRDGNGRIVITVEELGYELTRYDLSDDNFDPSVIKKDDVLIYPYTGVAGNVTLPKGRYKIECWGAQGGNALYNGNTYKGGLGGYTTGKLNIYEPATLYLYAGGKGQQCTGSTKVGGFNGGGSGYGYSSYYAGSGGGASDVRIGEDSLYSRVIVAGGGGGANSYNYSTTTGTGGAGGNEIGERRFYSTSYYANGGNRTESGKGNYTGSFGTGSTSTTSYVAGGGGGWYSGGSGQQCPGAGGSSYVYTEETEGYYPSGCLLTEDYYLDSTSMSRGIKTNNGKIYITVEDLDIEEPIKDHNTYEITRDTIDTTTLEVGDELNCLYSGAYKTITLPKGKYKLECWGAQGGCTNDYLGGLGAYSKGSITLDKETTLNLYVGGSGKLCIGSAITGGFNGGGSGLGYNTYYAGTGGGGTDIRIGSTSLYARVIVAGGGGGVNDYNSATTGGYGGAGGNEIGERRFYSTSYYANGGSLDVAGYGNYTGSFGTGSTSTTSYVAGGGGGWYPGGSGQQCPGAGGSSYVYTNKYLSSYPTGCLLDSSHLLDDAYIDTNARRGHGKIKITVEALGDIEDTDSEYTIEEVNKLPNLKSGDVINCSYSESIQKITLPAGKYKLECWGARGGHGSYDNLGAKGGYSSGIISLNKEFTDLYLYTGGRGKTCPGVSKTGGFNGGGSAKGYASYPAGSGGGGTDIRIDSLSLHSRVIVAGGGGGANSYTGTEPGSGGGNNGGSSLYDETYYANGGTQTAAGTSNYATGTFGKGSTSTTTYVAGGGGGWYPGSQGQQCAAGGGSGYVYNEENVVNYPEGCLLTSDYYLEEASTTNNISDGDGKIRITVIEAATYINLASDDTIDDIINNIKEKDILTCPYSNSAIEITLPKGIYKLECWGAQGGDALYNGSIYSGGLGGYSVGVLKIYEPTKFYLYTGGQGQQCTGSIKVGGFNGGGSGYGNSTYPCGSGGGGTDIRIGEDSLYARLLVAGGGGGASSYGSYSTTNYPAGTGGGITGGTCTYDTSYYSNGGTQTAAGTGSVATGTFGTGSTTNSTAYGAGGGGGWYPGGNSARCAAGGGSGYVYDETNAVNYPSGCLLTSDYYLTEGTTTNGTRAGNGEIRITVLKRPLPMLMRTENGWEDKTFNLFIKTERGWEEVFGNPNEYFDISSSTYITDTTIK